MPALARPTHLLPVRQRRGVACILCLQDVVPDVGQRAADDPGVESEQEPADGGHSREDVEVSGSCAAGAPAAAAAAVAARPQLGIVSRRLCQCRGPIMEINKGLKLLSR